MTLTIICKDYSVRFWDRQWTAHGRDRSRCIYICMYVYFAFVWR